MFNFFHHHKSKVPPQIKPFTFGSDELNEGDTAAIQCIVLKGNIPLKIDWFFNGDLINEHDLSVKILKMGPKISGLNVESVDRKHIGNYTCIVNNLAGRKEYSAFLNINGDFITAYHSSFILITSFPNPYTEILKIWEKT